MDIIQKHAKKAFELFTNSAQGKVALGAILLLGAYSFNAFLKNYGLYPKKSLKKKHVFLTGAGGGLGYIFSRMLGELGCKLTLVDVNKITLNKVAVYME